MDIKDAVKTLAALAQDSRLAVFRLLVSAGPEGIAAGQLAGALNVPHNTLSSHLNRLTTVGLISAERDGRSIIYRAELDELRGLLQFLIEDCCQGQPTECAALLDLVLPGCCPTPRQTNDHPNP